MGELDRLGWAAGLAFVSHGARIGIRVNEPGVLEGLPAFLPPGAIQSNIPIVPDLYSLIVPSTPRGSNVRRYNLLYIGSSRLARTMDPGEAFTALEEHLHVLVAVRAPRKLFVRAGVVGWRNQAVLILGGDETRRSCVVTALVNAGATHYSNRYAVFDSSGRVHAYPTPFVTDRDACATDHRRRNNHRPLAVGLIVLQGHAPATSSSLRELSPAQAVLGVLSHTVVSRLRPAFALRILKRAVPGAPALEMTRAERDPEPRQLLDRLDGVPSATHV